MGTRHALVVDDVEINQLLICKILEKQGVTSDVAFDGEEAIKKVTEKAYDLIFMDIQMPSVDGYQAAKAIRKMKERKDLPIIAVTAHALPEDKEKCLRAGMDDYISKPVNARQIIDVVARFFPDRQHEEAKVRELDRSSSQMLFEKVNRDISFMEKMITQFCKSSEPLLDKLNYAFKNQNHQSIHQIAHTLKGLAGAIEAQGATRLLAEIERDAKSKTGENMLLLFQQLETEINATLQQHQDFIDKMCHRKLKKV